MPEPLPPRTWGVLAYIMADQAFLSVEDAEGIDKVATDEAKKIVRAARGLDDVYLAVHVDLTETPGSLRYEVPGPREPERRAEGRAGFEGLISFLESAKQKFPAKYYMVILWGHGSGPLGLFADPAGGDADEPGHLTLHDLHRVLTGLKVGHRPIDILMVKSCYMASLEAAREIDSLADYMICSQARVPLRTWTIWEEVFEQLEGEPQAVALAVLRAIDRHYSDVVERNDRAEVPFSLLRPARVRELDDEIGALVAALGRHIGEPEVAGAIEAARPAVGGDKALVDFRQLCTNLINLERPDLSEFADKIDELLRRTVVIEHTPAVSSFGGIGVFHFPRDPLLRAESFANAVTEDIYCSLEFPRVTGWCDFAFPAKPGVATQPTVYATIRTSAAVID